MRRVGDIWTPFGDFGAPCVGFGVLFGGFGWPLGAQSDNYPERRSAAEVRVTRFWSPMALGKQPNFDGKGP